MRIVDSGVTVAHPEAQLHFFFFFAKTKIATRIATRARMPRPMKRAVCVSGVVVCLCEFVKFWELGCWLCHFGLRIVLEQEVRGDGQKDQEQNGKHSNDQRELTAP